MKTEIYPALKEFEEKLHRAFPEEEFEVEEPFEDEDLSLEIYLPMKSPEVSKRIAGILVDLEERYGVDFSFVLHLKDGVPATKGQNRQGCPTGV